MENGYLENFKSFQIFWKSLQPWVKKLIFWASVAIGLAEWISLVSGAFLFLALIFMGHGTPALILQIVIAAIVIGLLPLTVWLTDLVTKWFLYVAFYLTISNGFESLGKSIFIKGEESE